MERSRNRRERSSCKESTYELCDPVSGQTYAAETAQELCVLLRALVEKFPNTVFDLNVNPAAPTDEKTLECGAASSLRIEKSNQDSGPPAQRSVAEVKCESNTR